MSSIKTKITPSIIVTVCFWSIISLQYRQYDRWTQKSTANNYLQEELARTTQLDLYQNVPGFGFNNLIADVTFLQYVQYFGDRAARQQLGYSLIPKYFAAIVDRDANFTQAYLSLINANSLYAGEPQTTVNLMEQTLPYIDPKLTENIAQIWSQKATDELLLLGNTEAAKKSYQMAAYSAIKIDSCLSRKLAKRHLATLEFLADNPDTKSAQILAWSTVLPNIKNLEKRQEIINKINNLKQESGLFDPNNNGN